MADCDWDTGKDASNRRKHGVSFAVAATVLDDPFALVAFDRNVDGEDRWRMIGRTANGTTVVIAFAIRERAHGEVVRIISARYALRHERQRYEQQAR